MTPVPRYLTRFRTVDIPQLFTEVLVLGTGIAGHMAALEASGHGVRVTVLTKQEELESNTLYAQAGIAASLAADDSTDQHVADTVAAGDGLCEIEHVRAVVEAGPACVARLAELGVVFDMDPETGGLSLGREGGHHTRRVAHASGDGTGREIQRALAAAVAADPEIHVEEGAFAVDLLVEEGRVLGALANIRGELRVVWARAVVLATGGAGRLFRESTNPAVTTGDGIAMAYRAGARVRDMEFIQFHPTVLYVPGAGRTLISEAARGEGAVIRDQRGDRFLEAFDPRGELAPRDIVSRGIVSHLVTHGDTHVLLDLTGIPRERLESRLPGVVATGRSVGIDVLHEPLPVRPAAHYTIGGVETDAMGRTGIEGLFAAGEVSSSGLHGANRLASNSLLEGVVTGTCAGRQAADLSRSSARARRRSLAGEGPGPDVEALDLDDLVRSVRSLIWRYAGVRRDAEHLAEARRELLRWSPRVLRHSFPGVSGMEAQNLCILAGLLVENAALREETRGVHWRTDCPERDDARFLGHLVQEIGRPARFVPLGDGGGARA